MPSKGIDPKAKEIVAGMGELHPDARWGLEALLNAWIAEDPGDSKVLDTCLRVWRYAEARSGRAYGERFYGRVYERALAVRASAS